MTFNLIANKYLVMPQARENCVAVLGSRLVVSSPQCSYEVQIIQVNLTSEDLQPIAAGTKIEFTYSVTWAPTPTQFTRRFERYLDYNFFEHQVQHQLSAVTVHSLSLQRSLQSKP